MTPMPYEKIAVVGSKIHPLCSVSGIQGFHSLYDSLEPHQGELLLKQRLLVSWLCKGAIVPPILSQECC